MRIIKISSAKTEKLGEHIEKALRYMGKAMQCVEEMNDGDEMNERDEMEDDEDWGKVRMNNRGHRTGRNRY